jgi:hypothetical protein
VISPEPEIHASFNIERNLPLKYSLYEDKLAVYLDCLNCSDINNVEKMLCTPVFHRIFSDSCISFAL